jgi:hypothetical protein
VIPKGTEYFFSIPSLINADNIKVEVWDAAESSILREVVFKKTNSPVRQKICVISPIKNEIDILPFFIDYYLNFVGVDKIIFSDGNSDDGSIEYIKTFGDKTEVIIEDHKEYHESNLTGSRNEIWKKYKNDYDWFIVADADEFLYHPNIKEKIVEYREKGITVPTVFGYEMYSTEFPKFEQGTYLPSLIKKGEKRFGLNKCIIFDPKNVNMRYSFGSHQSYPDGNVVQNSDTDLYMLHYKYLSHEYLVKKSKYGDSRRSEAAKTLHMASHWEKNSVISEDTYNSIISGGSQIIE